jgi:hypothetical protein
LTFSIGNCGCSPNPNFTSSYSACSVDAEFSNYCVSVPEFDKIPVTSWRNTKICVLRDGIPSISYKNGYFKRPSVSKGTCPSGYKLCGNGSEFDIDRSICFPVEYKCPITAIVMSDTYPNADDGAWVQANGSYILDNNYSLYIRREGFGELPIVDLKTALAFLSSPEEDDFVDGNYDPGHNKRGICMKGKTQKTSDSEIKPSLDSLSDYSVSYPNECKSTDKRYVLWENIDLATLYTKPIRDTAYCQGLDVYLLDDPSYNVSTDPDYANNQIPCDDVSRMCMV